MVEGFDKGLESDVRQPRRGKPVKHLRRKNRWRKRVIIALIVIVVLGILTSATGYGYYLYREHQLHHINVNNLIKVSNSQPENILLVGNNSRCALNGQQSSTYGSCSQVGGARSDVTMVIHLNPANGSAYLLSIPRDLFVPIANFSSTYPGRLDHAKIDASLNVSPDNLVQTVEEDLGIPINHFVELNFDTFQQVVNDLGGVNMYFPTEVKDTDASFGVFQTGCVYLNGTQALGLVRSRHMYYLQNGQWVYDGLGDIGRIRRTHEFLRVLASQVRQKITNPLTANSLIGTMLPSLVVDQNFTLHDMISLALAFRNVSPSSVPSATVPSVGVASFYFKGADFGDVVFPVQPADQQIINQFLGGSPQGSGINPGSFSLEVLNGTSTYNQAITTAQSLTNDGYNVVGTGNYPITGTQVETSIYYNQGYQAQAEKLLSSLSGTVIMGQRNLGNSANVTLVTGTQFEVAQSAPPSSTSSTSQTPSSQVSVPQSSAPSGTTTTTSPYGPINPADVFQAQVPLPWFDPRSCTSQSTPAS